MVSRFLLLWHPPGQSGRFVVGGWALESWRGGSCVWSMELAGLGAYFWVDTELAKGVAAGVLRVHRVRDPRWLPCGGNGGPVFMTGAPVDEHRDLPVRVRSAPAEPVQDVPGPRRQVTGAGVPAT